MHLTQRVKILIYSFFYDLSLYGRKHFTWCVCVLFVLMRTVQSICIPHAHMPDYTKALHTQPCFSFKILRTTNRKCTLWILYYKKYFHFIIYIFQILVISLLAICHFPYPHQNILLKRIRKYKINNIQLCSSQQEMHNSEIRW